MTRNPRFIGRDPAAVAQDLAAIRATVGDAIDTAAQVWHDLDSLARDHLATPYTRRRARQAADALGSILDDIHADQDAAERPFTWNDQETDR